MYSAIVVLALCGYVSAGVIGYGAPAAHVLSSGASSQFRSQDNIGNYAFGYNEDHATGGTFRREQGGPGVQVGSYGLRDADGRTRVVNYVADAAGFRANIQTNEPGVEAKDPAAVSINRAEAVIAPAVLAAPAPLVAHAAVAAPVAHYAAPVAHYAAPVAHWGAPVAASSYSVSTQHLSAPVVSYAAAPLAAPLVAHAAAPIAYATKSIASPVLSQQYVSHW